MNAKELLQEWKERCNRLPRTAEGEDYQAILRALSLLAAAEANDGTTPETDAEAFDAIRIAVGRTIDLSVVSADFARRLERERNGLARAHADALEENARLKAAWDASHAQAMKNGAACNEWRDRAERAEADLAKLKGALESLAQSLTDPENQPSQFGTVTLEWHEAYLAKLRQHAEAMAKSIDRTVFSTTAQQDALAAYRADFPEK